MQCHGPQPKGCAKASAERSKGSGIFLDLVESAGTGFFCVGAQVVLYLRNMENNQALLEKILPPVSLS